MYEDLDPTNRPAGASAMRMHKSPIRLAIVVQHPVHYHLPLFRAIASDSNIDLNVLFMQRANSDD